MTRHRSGAVMRRNNPAWQRNRRSRCAPAEQQKHLTIRNAESMETFVRAKGFELEERLVKFHRAFEVFDIQRGFDDATQFSHDLIA